MKKRISTQLLFEPFFVTLLILGSIQPKSECIFPFLYNFIFKPYHRSSSLAPFQEGDTHMPSQTFCPKFDGEKLLFEAFFWDNAYFFFEIMHIFGSIQPKSECIFPFLYNFIFKPYRLSSPLALLRGEDTHTPSQNFFPKFDTEKLLFEIFFGTMRIFAAFSWKVNVFLRFYTISYLNHIIFRAH